MASDQSKLNVKYRNAFDNMIRRCSDPDEPNYGARGIRVAKELQTWEGFKKHVPPPPSLAHTLDRKNFSLGYFPGNLQWVDWPTQNNNRRTTVKFWWQGQALSMAELSRATGINYWTLRHRIMVLGMDVDEAVDLSVQNCGRHVCRPVQAQMAL